MLTALTGQERKRTMTRLEELLEQKRLIEKEIKKIKDSAVYSEPLRAKLEHRIPACRADEWVLCIKSNSITYDHKDRYFPITYSVDRDEVIADIPHIISALQDLYRKVTDDEETV
jgi:hypothetical protein